MPDSRDVLSRPARPPDLTLSYGPLPEHVMDVRLPRAGDAPAALVVVVHGGFWMAEYDRGHASAQSAALTDAGYVVATVEYRRIGLPGGGWPGTFDDIALLTDTVQTLVAEAVGDAADTARTVLVGHSAGGHLATWAAGRHRLPESSAWHRAEPLAVAGVVSLAGVLDLAESERLGLGGHAARQLLGGPRLLPGRTAWRDRIPVASPAALLPTGVRIAIVHGSADRQVPVVISRGFAEQAVAAGDPVTLRELDGLGHFELIDPESAAWPTVLAAIAALVP